MSAVLKPSIEITGIPWHEAGQAWDMVAPLLQMAIDESDGENDLETLKDAVLRRKMQLWVGRDALGIIYAGLTQIVIYPTGRKVCEITHLGGGRMRDWLEHIDVICEWAGSNGCDAIRIIGRKGWERVMTGFTPIYTILTRQL